MSSMPKKKIRRKPTSRRSAPGTVKSQDQLKFGPARTLLHYPEDREMIDVLGLWPFDMRNAEGATYMTLHEVATRSGKSVMEVAQSFVDLEDNGFLVWQAANNSYTQTIPEGLEIPEEVS